MERIFEQDRYPETQYRTCDGLFRLYKQSGQAAFAKACEVALEHGVYSYKFVRKVLESGLVDTTGAVEDLPMPRHGNIRGKAYFTQTRLDL